MLTNLCREKELRGFIPEHFILFRKEKLKCEKDKGKAGQGEEKHEAMGVREWHQEQKNMKKEADQMCVFLLTLKIIAMHKLWPKMS